MITNRKTSQRSWLAAIFRLLASTLAILLLLLAVGIAGWLGYARVRMADVETQPRTGAAAAGGRWVHADDVDIHLQEWGPADGKPLLLVHGTGAWTGTWVSNVEAMAAAGFRVVAMDLPPFGYSSLPASGDYSRWAQAKRILAVVAQLGDKPVTLLGHSFGGGPAAEAVMLDSSRVAHLVLVDAAIGLRSSGQPSCKPPVAVQALLGWRPLRTTMMAAAATEPRFSQYLLSQFVARKEVVTVERTAIYQQPFTNQDFSAGLGDWAYQFAAGCELPASAQADNFKKLAMPVSLVWGEKDTITPLAQAHALQTLMPSARLTVLAGVGHIPQIEDVTAFNTAITQVLQTPP